MSETATVLATETGREFETEPKVRFSNVAQLALSYGRTDPGRVALVTEDAQGTLVPVTFGQLLEESERLAAGLERAGLRPGDRIALLFRPSVDFHALLLASLASGLVVVLVDASLTRSGMRRALREAKADAVVSYRRVLRWWPVIPELMRVKRISVDGRCLATADLDDLRTTNRMSLLGTRVPASDAAVISFTSGTGGAPKAAHRGHALLLAQHRVLKSTFPVNDDTCNMPCFPLVALHNLCCGVTSVLPAVDPRDPTDAAISRTVRTIEAWQVTDLCAAPDTLDRFAAFAEHRRSPIRCLRRIAVGGGPVDRALGRRIQRSFPNADVHVVYGCTEAEPIARVPLTDMLQSQGHGCLVGRPIREIDVMLAPLAPEFGGPSAHDVDRHRTPGRVGEVLVRGEHVYYARSPRRTAPSGAECWHRTGDLARFDANGRLWLLGRVGDVVMYEGRCLFPLEIETAAREVRGVARAAFVSHRGAPNGVLAASLETGADEPTVVAQLRAMLDAHGLHRVTVARLDAIPTDARHRSKVDRAALRGILTWLP